jgi:hypothetical protein
MGAKGRPKPEGHVRQSQVVRTFGPGAFIDLPEYSVMVGGLDDWVGADEEIQETRLVEKLKGLFTPPLASLKLCLPPPETDESGRPAMVGIPVWQFPEWFVTRSVLIADSARGVRSRRLVHRKMLTKDEYVDEDWVKHAVVPVRFVRACSRGHIGDIHWPGFVHAGKSACPGELWLDESGTTGDINETVARCRLCGLRRRLGEAYNPSMMALGSCDGYKPWLGPSTMEKCGEPNRVLDRTASNAYFPRVMSVISLPDRHGSLEKAVNDAWSLIQGAAAPEHLTAFRTIPAVGAALDGFTDDEVYREILARRGFSAGTTVPSVKQVEIEVLTAAADESEGEVPNGTYFARAYPRKHWDDSWTKKIEQVVLVHRLREVAAQLGFTRFEPATPDIEGDLNINAAMAPLAREIKFLPAVENRGEGIFLGFREDRIDAWKKKNAVKERERQLKSGFDCWLERHPKSSKVFPGLPFIMLHSLSHLLITAMSLECGYPASAIRERIYAGKGGYGILLFTGTPDSEGTMGGLIEVGRRISRHLRAALELGGLCSNDPVCAQHEAADTNEHRFLHGSACHGCLLIAETSCEQFNDFLDRALVVPTVENLGTEFFEM